MNLPANAAPIVTTSGISIATLIFATIGIKMIEATVCETKVATPAVKNSISSKASHGLATGNPEQRRMKKSIPFILRTF